MRGRRAACGLAALLLLAWALVACSSDAPRSAAPPPPAPASSPATEPAAPPPSPAPSATPPPAKPAVEVERASVTRVVDGDTIDVSLGSREERVRLIGVDTPEVYGGAEEYGEEASAFTKRGLSGKTVYLETDAELRDRYGRLLAYAWLEPPADDSDAEIRAKLFNASLLLQGFAGQLTIPPNVKYAERFRVYAGEARDAGRGLWAGPPPEEPKSQAPAAPSSGGYVASAKSDVFHYPDCQWAKKIKPGNLVEFSSRQQAVDSGRRPCKVCKP